MSVVADFTTAITADHLGVDEELPAGVRRAAVIGSPIAHSLSPVLHRAAYAALGLTSIRYDKFEVGETDLAQFVERLGPEWAGLSLTMPLKRVVIPLLDEISPLAEAVGAVNTLIFGPREPGALRASRRGDNTDVQGMVGALGDLGVSAEPPGRETVAPAVVLGGGATAASTMAALAKLGWREVSLCVRSRERSAEVVTVGERVGVNVRVEPLGSAAALMAEAAVTVATVPGGALGDLAERLVVGTRPDGGPAVLLDVIYDPWPTPLAAAWQRRGGLVASGLDMLIHQAVDQVAQMTGRVPSVEVLRAAAAR